MSTRKVPRSELELLQERSYLDSRHVWLAHRDGIARALLADKEDGVLPTVDISKTESTRLVRVEDGNILCRVDDTDIDKVGLRIFCLLIRLSFSLNLSLQLCCTSVLSAFGLTSADL